MNKAWNNCLDMLCPSFISATTSWMQACGPHYIYIKCDVCIWAKISQSICIQYLRIKLCNNSTSQSFSQRKQCFFSLCLLHFQQLSYLRELRKEQTIVLASEFLMSERWMMQGNKGFIHSLLFQFHFFVPSGKKTSSGDLHRKSS